MSRVQSHLTLEEWVSLIKNSRLPTVVTEGKDDYTVYRKLEDQLVALGLSFMPVGGKSTVLQLYSRRHEFSNSKVIFVVDKDDWVFRGVPTEFSSDFIVTSDGFSIENDVYRDGYLERLLDQNETAVLKKELNVICKWFSSAYRKIFDGDLVEISHHPNRMISDCRTKLRDEFKNEFDLGEPDTEFLILLEKQYAKYLRGKTLIGILTRQLSYPGRPAKFSRSALLEIGATARGPLLSSAMRAIEAAVVL